MLGITFYFSNYIVFPEKVMHKKLTSIQGVAKALILTDLHSSSFKYFSQFS